MTGLEYGDPQVARDGEILRSIVGSEVTGTATGTGDRDEMAVHIPPPHHLIGIRDHREDYIARTQPEGARSGPGDVDLTSYSLRKYLRLAIKGNPTALLPMFAPDDMLLHVTNLGAELRDLRDAFLSQEAVERFLGYMHSQQERMMGRGRQNRVPNRPELIEQHGWDVKYGAHALRLAHQGLEVAAHGTLTLPMTANARACVVACRNGERTRESVDAEITRIEATIRRILETGLTPLPEHPDYDRIETWAVNAHRRHWGWEKA